MHDHADDNTSDVAFWTQCTSVKACVSLEVMTFGKYRHEYSAGDAIVDRCNRKLMHTRTWRRIRGQCDSSSRHLERRVGAVERKSALPCQ